MQLRVVAPAPTADGCAGCSRRAVLRGFAMTAATALVGCGGTGSEPMEMVDAGPGSTTSACGNNLCLDLGDPTNAALTMVGGALIVDAPHDIIILVRTSTTAVAAVSDICTHAGCGVRYDHTNKIFSCPCHGSKYTLTGTVIQGPATRALTKYQTELDTTANQLTIVLS